MRNNILLLIFSVSVVFAQNTNSHNLNSTAAKNKIIINLQNNFGYTIVDVAQAMEIPEYSDITGEGLVDWDQLNYKGLIQVFIPKGKMLIGAEVGFNRLYRWEEAYIPSSSYSNTKYYRWGTIWTWHIGALIQLNFANQYYLTTGTGVYTFMNGTGTTVGFPLGLGHTVKISDSISIPIEFRTDIIFGSGAPIAIGGGLGLKFTL